MILYFCVKRHYFTKLLHKNILCIIALLHNQVKRKNKKSPTRQIPVGETKAL